MTKRINWKVVALDLAEAREEIQKLEAMAARTRGRSEIEFEIGLGHAYHHLNFAWNARHASDNRYRNLSNLQFTRWSRFPAVMKPYRAAEKRKAGRKAAR